MGIETSIEFRTVLPDELLGRLAIELDFEITDHWQPMSSTLSDRFRVLSPQKKAQLNWLCSWGSVEFRFVRADQPCYVVMASPTWIVAETLDAGMAASKDEQWRPSRFLHIRTDDSGDLVLMSPKTDTAIRPCTQDAEIALVRLLAGRESVSLDLDLLAGLVEQVGGQATSSESDEQEQGLWEFHDAVMHYKSRSVAGVSPVGATYRGSGPGLNRAEIGTVIPGNLPEIGSEHSPYMRLARARRTAYEGAADPRLSRGDLGEFLNVAVGAITVSMPNSATRPSGLVGRFPYGSGGALYSVDVNLVAGDVLDLDPGCYLYDPLANQLRDRSVSSARVGTVLRILSRQAPYAQRQASAAIVLSSRFNHVAGKYQGVAYSLVLKECGEIIQSMYLAAAELGLGVTPLGGGMRNETQILNMSSGEIVVSYLLISKPATQVSSRC